MRRWLRRRELRYVRCPRSRPCDPDHFGLHCQFNNLWADVHAHRRLWFQLDYLQWRTKGNSVPALVTSSPPGTPQSEAGVLPDSATTTTLFGNGRLDQQFRQGGRINFGYWLMDGEYCGIEGQYFGFAPAHTDFNASSNQFPICAPFLNVDPALVTPRQDASLVGFPGIVIGPATGDLTGNVNVHTSSNIQGANAMYRRLIWIDFTSQQRLDWIVGYRFFRLDDSVTINTDSTFNPTSGPIAQTQFIAQDQFGAINQFQGGDIGLKGQCYWWRLSIELVGKCAFGANFEKATINGSNSVSTLGQTTTNVGGLLAQPSNIGTYTKNVFAVLPEADANLRFDITTNIRATLGYSFLYMNRVQRLGDTIDTTLNPTQINGGTLIGQAAPTFAWHQTTFWAQGANAGIEVRWYNYRRERRVSRGGVAHR